MGLISTLFEHFLIIQVRVAFLLVSQIKIETASVKDIIANLSRCFGFITAWFTVIINEGKVEMLQIPTMDIIL